MEETQENKSFEEENSGYVLYTSEGKYVGTSGDVIANLQKQIQELDRENEDLRKKLDAELEWRDSDVGTKLTQEKYEDLAEDGRQLTEDEAKEKIYQEFGFAKEKIRIVSCVNTYEVNRHSRMRVKETFNRPPVYSSTDWNYIRFDCAGRLYEMIDGELYNYAL